MTLRTVTQLKCECGHKGTYTLSENDQPNGTPWESHTLQGFMGGGVHESDQTKMHCPACRQVGKVKRV